MEKRKYKKCAFCGEVKAISYFGSEEQENCQSCRGFIQKAETFRAKLDDEEYEQWYLANEPKPKFKPKKNTRFEWIKRILEENNNCYVKKIDNDLIANLQIALHKKLSIKETSDNNGYIIEVIN